MRRIAIYLILLCVCLPAAAQTQQVPPNFRKKEFFGDMLAILSFCNFHDITDRYEMFVAFKELGVTSADRSEIFAIRDKNYQIYRNKFDTPATQEKFCKDARSQFFFVKTKRKDVPIVAGSDTEKQPEKIETFGDVLGVLVFCRTKIDINRWGGFLVDMGVKSESMDALGKQAVQTERALVVQYGSPEHAPDVCAKAKNSFSADRFIKQ
jgi:hypothetical protein